MEQDAYLRSLLSTPSKEIEQLEHEGHKQGVPIMEPLGIDFLMQLIRLNKPQTMLEIGTAIGYSALRMLEAAPESSITTIERDTERYQQAVENISKFQAEQHINILCGDALELKEQVSQAAPFDLIFIDAAKGKYEEFFHLYAPLLSEDGMIVSDNVLFKGYVANNHEASGRMAKLAAKIRDFNQWLTSQENYHTSIVPIGDGVAVTVKNHKK
ncbi:O-methyltransferase [Halobacillus shinanisalinarum]|uniref:tRNA 5-hydroxyuridine methyltransferase n=1 Tax=Halobacillus shinanisalinarum TaxID=2932258 RepID=A0ABY4H054_9BACI|nr:O-methyltransferase [Halobacillus shinanisalinarum]UOQ93821.1 O-methyltransferase [Halobacillus shinanisalinarum]